MADKPPQVNPERGWGQFLKFYFQDGLRIENFARNGRSTKSFIAQGLWDSVLQKLKPGDYVFIQFGHNDQKNSDTSRYAEAHTTYKQNLIRFVNDTRNRGAIPVLLTPANRRKFSDEGKFIDQHGDYPQVVRETGKELQVPVADIHAKTLVVFSEAGTEGSKKLFLRAAPGVYKNFPEGKFDDTHFNRHGASLIAGMVAESIHELNLPLKKYLVEKSGYSDTIHTALGMADLIVAKDLTGDFYTIQEALDAIPAANDRHYTIFIKNGVYNEKVFLTKSNITLIGESPENTKIQFAELRKNWRKNNDSDWGSAVVNIQNGVHDVVFRNLTMHNNYGSLFNETDHQFTIRGGGTRIILDSCRVISDGGDALSLWNAKDGMYYHKNCWFEGYVDYVCPRGWCYITDSKFFGHNLSASIWMDGDYDRDQKFVLRNCTFDGVPGFPLGRHHREAAFYLLNCSFSSTMADKPIYFCGPSKIKWENRYYFDGCHRDGGDFAWFKNNLTDAAPNLKNENITPLWTFQGKWDPEKVLDDLARK